MISEKELQQVKNRYEIVGNSPLLNHALETALRVASTDMSVLIYGESGVGKEVFSKIIHQNSARKHGSFIAVNCGAIPEGTIDSELFGHEKGSFTGATEARKGYFETVNGGTIFLDEVGELPLGTQARLLRVLETGEFIRVGSSKIQKTNVRVVAATNRNLLNSANSGKFRIDLYYRLATVPIVIPRLSERKEDVYLIFLKFVNDFAEKYHTRYIELTPDAKTMLENYSWPGNVRQLRNVTEQLCVLERDGIINAQTLINYLPPESNTLPAVSPIKGGFENESFSERDLLYKVLFDLKKDMSDLKKLVFRLIENGGNHSNFIRENEGAIRQIFSDELKEQTHPLDFSISLPPINDHEPKHPIYTNEAEPHTIRIEEAKTIQEQERDMIKKSLERNKGRRKKAAVELGISERTLYRKIKQYELE
ncbi:MAG: sigma-54-dependent Fis family transcriptional regulator [Bacteroidetes bacterium]|nr:sigma-54-dependent Fis family transcriptional regulator [Bacteroidota bacterium]